MFTRPNLPTGEPMALTVARVLLTLANFRHMQERFEAFLTGDDDATGGWVRADWYRARRELMRDANNIHYRLTDIIETHPDYRRLTTIDPDAVSRRRDSGRDA